MLILLSFKARKSRDKVFLLNYVSKLIMTRNHYKGEPNNSDYFPEWAAGQMKSEDIEVWLKY
jgi:hypothetical protein